MVINIKKIIRSIRVIRGQKKITMKVIEKKYLLPFVLVTSLFALWGLANNMTDTLLAAFRKIMQMSDTQTSFIQMAFYGAYFCLALPAALFIRKHSYKSGVILGLCLYAAGAIFFLPAASAASYKNIQDWAAKFEGVPLDIKKMILARMIERITVDRDYNIEIHFYVTVDDFDGKIASAS